MKKPILLAVLFLISFSTFASERFKYNFNSQWKVFVGDAKDAEQVAFDDSAWKNVTLPYAWNENDAFSKPIHEHTTGISWYRKHFKIPANQQGKKVFIELEGVRFGGEFYLNGKFIGRHENGIMAVGFDISDAVLFGDKDNVIAVRLDNSWSYREKETNSTYQWNDKNFNANYGGIPKNTWLHITPKVYQTLPLYANLKTTGTYIYASNFNIPKRSATINASSEVKNESAKKQSVIFEVEVKDLEGKTQKIFRSKAQQVAANSTTTVSASSALNQLNFWSWGYGYLYTIHTRLIVNNKVTDDVITKTGFRKTAFKDGMVYLNDQVLMMKGYAQRTSNEWPAVGMSVAPWLSDYSNALMVESNANLVRWMHVAPWKQDVESCDRVGLIQAMPAGDAERDVQGRRWEQRVEVMRDAIIYNRNSPSIIFYECGNESISEEHMAEMKSVRDKYDAYGGRAIGSREMLDSKVSEYGGEMLYINKSDTQPMWSTEYMRDEGLRKYWDEYTYPYHKNGAGPLYKNQDASDYNRNQDSHAVEAIIRWVEYWNQRPGTGKRVSSGGVNIIFSDSNTHYRGEENYRRSGEVDAMRIPKDAFFAHQVMWDGWVNPKPTGLHIMGHWNYEKGVVKDHYVVAAGEKVELFVNDKSLGFGERTQHFLFTFKNVAFVAGELKAISYDNRGNKLAEKSLKTAGLPYAVKMTYKQAEDGFKADGADMVMIEFEIVDKEGNRCPTALNMVDFEIDGPGEWKGGIAQGPNNYILSKSLPAEGGVNRVLIRSLENKPGLVRVKAKSNGLQASNITLESKAVTIENGLSLAIPSNQLSSNLKRGASPKENTVEVVRVNLPIKSAKAGSNNDEIQKSIDNNELSDWVNDGNLNTAWVEYELEKSEVVNEVVLKLNNFRTRTYPLKIYVDDQLVFHEKTSTSLGYYTAKCIPTKGKKVKIMLASDSDNAKVDLMEEVGGKKLDDGVSRNDANAKGRLSIIEAEIYKRL
jgi:beta-galactosidase